MIRTKNISIINYTKIYLHINYERGQLNEVIYNAYLFWSGNIVKFCSIFKRTLFAWLGPILLDLFRLMDCEKISEIHFSTVFVHDLSENQHHFLEKWVMKKLWADELIYFLCVC